MVNPAAVDATQSDETRQAENLELSTALLDEARRRYDHEVSRHDQTLSELRTWLTVAALVLGGIVAMAPACRAAPTGCWAAFRLLLVILAAVALVVAGAHLHRFFLGQKFTRIGPTLQWLSFAQGAADPTKRVAAFQQSLAEQYATAADEMRHHNLESIGDHLTAKRWLAYSAAAVLASAMAHFLAL